MADFSIWVTACEPALGWPAGHFLETYQNNRRGAVERAIETDLIASTIRRLMSDKAEWQGTATELLANLEKLVSKRTKKSKPLDLPHFRGQFSACDFLLLTAPPFEVDG